MLKRFRKKAVRIWKLHRKEASAGWERGNDMIREKRKRKKKWKRIGITFLILTLFCSIGAFVVVKVFTVKKVVVNGNEHYDDAVIEQWVLNDEYSWNTLYVYLKYRFREPELMPFVDTMEVTMKPPHTIEIEVYEKGILGYVYLESLGQNAYFDKDGIVVETSSELIEGVPRVLGLPVDAVVLYEQLPIPDERILKNLLSLTQMLKKYELVPDAVTCNEDRTYSLSYEGVKVSMGSEENFNDKVLRLSYILPRLAGMNGTLHLESWTENTTDISFVKEE